MSLEKLVLMSEAHLRNVQKTIEDLNTQKLNVEQEINKLTEYFQQGRSAIGEALSSTQGLNKGENNEIQ